jgi:hypothetical protein
MVIDRAVHAPRDAAEPPKVTHDRAGDDDKDDRLCALREAAGGEHEVVKHVGGHEDAKVERRELATRRGVEGGKVKFGCQKGEGRRGKEMGRCVRT